MEIASFQLIPKPQGMILTGEAGMDWDAGKYLVTNGNEGIVLGELLSELPKKNEIAGKGSISLSLDITDESLDSPESYRINVLDGSVEIIAKDKVGLFYACQTLEQMLEDAKDQNLAIPGLEIIDYPDISYRSVHLDLKHHIDHLDYYYQVIDRLSKYKLNALIIEFEDKLGYTSLAKIAADDALSKEDWIKLVTYARKRNIHISPLVQGLSHADYILKHDEYKHLREVEGSDESFCPMDSGTYEVLFALYKEAIEATPGGRYLHIGGDEVREIGLDQRCKQTGMSAFELQMTWLKKVCDFVIANGRTPIFWDDMILKNASVYFTTYEELLDSATTAKAWHENEHKLNELLKLFPEQCAYMRWNYENSASEGNRKALNWYKSKGLMAMAATAAQTTSPMMPRRRGKVEDIKTFNEISAEYGLLGILCTTWDDASPHWETYTRGLLGHAEFGWNAGGKSELEFNRDYLRREYGIPSYSPDFFVEDQLGIALNFWDTAFVSNSRRKSMYDSKGKFQLMDLPINEPGAWTINHQGKINLAQIEVKRHNSIDKGLALLLSNAKRNQYRLRLLKTMNNLQVYDAKMLLAISAFDKARNNETLKGIENLLATFEGLREDYEEVFSETRNLNKATGYMLSQNNHYHLANWTVNSDWMYYFEIPFNRELKKFVNNQIIQTQ